MDGEERDALLTLLLTPGIGHVFARQIHERFGLYAAALEASSSQLAQAVNRLSIERATNLRRAMDQTRQSDAVAQEESLISEHQVRLIEEHDADYPALLRHISDPPALLWVRGDIREDDALALGMVGSRRCTHYGREQAARFASQAAQAGLCIVSGGAYGIDAAAHRAALAAGGRTIAVLGSGLAKPYPKEHEALFDEISGGVGGDPPRGAVISELPMATAPNAENFPRRNRIISGLSLGILVVEAAARSGALITARLCVEDHGRELMAVPGRVDSKTSDGCHKMIREGWAKLVTNIGDVLDALGEAGQMLQAGMKAPVEKSEETAAGEIADEDGRTALLEQTLTETQRKIMDVLDEPKSLNQLAAATTLTISQLQSDLTMMELRGAIQRRGGEFARRKKT